MQGSEHVCILSKRKERPNTRRIPSLPSVERTNIPNQPPLPTSAQHCQKSLASRSRSSIRNPSKRQHQGIPLATNPSSTKTTDQSKQRPHLPNIKTKHSTTQDAQRRNLAARPSSTASLSSAPILAPTLTPTPAAACPVLPSRPLLKPQSAASKCPVSSAVQRPTRQMRPATPVSTALRPRRQWVWALQETASSLEGARRAA